MKVSSRVRNSTASSSRGRRQNAQRERLRRYLRDKGFGYLQNSVWITPDPPAQEREILGGGKINVESLLLLEARPCAHSLAHRMGEGGRQAG